MNNLKDFNMAQKQQIVDRLQVKNNLKQKNRVQQIIANAKSKIGTRDLYRPKNKKFKVNNLFKYKLKDIKVGLRNVFTRKNIIPIFMVGALGLFGITLISNNYIIAKLISNFNGQFKYYWE